MVADLSAFSSFATSGWVGSSICVPSSLSLLRVETEKPVEWILLVTRVDLSFPALGVGIMKRTLGPGWNDRIAETGRPTNRREWCCWANGITFFARMKSDIVEEWHHQPTANGNTSKRICLMVASDHPIVPSKHVGPLVRRPMTGFWQVRLRAFHKGLPGADSSNRIKLHERSALALPILEE